MSAAAQARRRRREDELEIVAFERGDFTSYSACGLPYYVGDLVTNVDTLIARSPEEHRRRGIRVHTRHEVIGIDTAARTVTVRDLDAGRERVESYDQVLVATGAVPIRPDVEGIDAQGIHGIQTITDGLALRRHLDGYPGHTRAVVIGGGYIGLEMAEAMQLHGMRVTLIDRNPQPMNTLDPDMGSLVGEALRDLGVEVRSGESAIGFEVVDRHVDAVVTDAGTVPTDIVVLGVGVRPNVALAESAGVDVGPSGGLATTSRMQTSADGVWAAGDCVEINHRISGRPVAIALGTHANKQGRVVGINVTGGDIEFPGVVGTAVTKVGPLEVARTGLRSRDLDRLGIDHVSATIESSTRAGYYPGAESITVKLIAETGSRRVMGGQIVGREGAARRVDIVALALWNEMTADDLSQVDLGYAPPFSPTWDPVLTAARRLAANLG